MATSTLDLAQSRVLLTGASSGIGRALALKLADASAQLVIVARRQAALAALAEEIIGRGGPAPMVIEADLSIQGLAHRVATEALTRGGIDILINNAGSSIFAGQAVAGDSDVARAVFETNLWSPLALIQALTPAMQRAQRGMIVNVTSTLQAVPMPLMGYYTASKVALARSTQALRLELKDTLIHVLEVVPGGTDTPLRHSDHLMPVKQPLPKSYLVTPESMADAILHAMQQRHHRIIHPAYARLPIALPALGQLVARIAAKRIDAGSQAIITPDHVTTSGAVLQPQPPHQDAAV